MSYRILFLTGCICLSSLPVVAMEKLRAYKQQRLWQQYAPAFVKAAQEGDLPTIRTMLANNIDLNITTEEFNACALVAAAAKKQSDAVRLLVERGANVHQIGGTGCSAAVHFLTYTHQDMLCFLLKNGHNLRCPENSISAREMHNSLEGYARQRAGLLAECLDQVEGGESRTVANQLLTGLILPAPVSNIALSYVSSHKETEQEEAQTVRWLARLNKQQSF